MQKLKKFLSLALALVIVFGAVAPAMAAVGDTNIKFVVEQGDADNDPDTSDVDLGKLTGTTEFSINSEEKKTVEGKEVKKTASEQGVVVPTVEAIPGYRFVGWDPSPKINTALAAGIYTYTAQFKKIDAVEGESTNTVTLHKLMMTKAELDAWKLGEDPNGYTGAENLDQLKSLAGKELEEIPGVYFVLKFADTYTDKTKAGKYVKVDTEADTNKLTPIYDTDGNPQATDSIDDAVGGLTTKTGLTFNTEKLKGDFVIDEIKEKSTYKSQDGKVLADQKAVPVEITLPLVNLSGVVADAHVYPKNTEDKPEIDKNFARDNGLLNAETAAEITGGADYLNYEAAKEKASAQVGTVVPYEVKTKVPAGTEYQKLTWNDTMTNGLTYNKDLSDGLKVEKITVKDDPATPDTNEEQRETINLVKDTDYKLTEDDRGFTLALTEAGLKKVSAITKPVDTNGLSTGEGVDVEFTLKYSAKVNSNAVTDVPDKNNITLEYGNNEDNEIEEKEVTPLNKELQVNKTWSEGTAPYGVYVTYTLKDADAAVASVTLNGKETAGTKYTVGDGITFEVTGAYLGKFVGLDDAKTYTISERVAGYTPEYTESVAGSVSVKNNKDTEGPEPLDPTEPEVVTYGKKFVKTDSSTEQNRLAGAQFVVKNEAGKYLAVKPAGQTSAEATAYEEAEKAYQDAIATYNKAVADLNAEMKKEGYSETDVKITIGNEEITGKTSINAKLAEIKNSLPTLKDDRDAKFLIAREGYNWVTLTTAPTETNTQGVLVLTSNDLGQFEINGLAAGTYSLVEIKAPEGFAKLNEAIPFTIGPANPTADDINYEKADDPDTKDVDESKLKDALQVVNKKVTIPQTGGIGTIIFTVGGIALMGGAAVAMKKNKEEDEE